MILRQMHSQILDYAESLITTMTGKGFDYFTERIVYYHVMVVVAFRHKCFVTFCTGEQRIKPVGYLMTAVSNFVYGFKAAFVTLKKIS